METKKRNSNLELLRIAAMLMIVCSHIFYHCINGQLTAAWDPELFCQPVLFKRLGILALISPAGVIGNAIFILISGYFMAPREASAINLTKTAKKLLLQLGFAAFVLVISSSLYVLWANAKWNIDLCSYITFFSFNSFSWFVGYYFLVIVVAKIFLNSRLAKYDKRSYLMLVVTLFALVQFSWSTSLLTSLMSGLDTLVTGVFLYALGGYIRKYDPFEKVRLWVLIAIIILTNVVIYVNYHLTTLTNIHNFNPDGGNLFIQTIPGYNNSNIVTLILGIAIFELFRRIPSFSSKIVNYISSATFMIYLLHDNDFFYTLWMSVHWLPLLSDNILSFMLCMAKWTGITFGFGVAAYTVYLLLGKLLMALRPLAVRK